MSAGLAHLSVVDATFEPFEFTFDGHEYVLPGKSRAEAAGRWGEDDLDTQLRMLLGPEQWQQIQDSPKSFTSKTWSVLFAAYANHLAGAA